MMRAPSPPSKAKALLSSIPPAELQESPVPEPRTWSLVLGFFSLILGPWILVLGLWPLSLVHGSWSLVPTTPSSHTSLRSSTSKLQHCIGTTVKNDKAGLPTLCQRSPSRSHGQPRFDACFGSTSEVHDLDNAPFCKGATTRKRNS